MFDVFHEANRQIRKVHNQLRVNPQSLIPYVQQRLGFYQQSIYFSKDLPNLGIVTVEGIFAVKDLIQYLQAVNPVSDLKPSLALQLAAYRHCQDLANNPHLNQHTGSDGTNAEDRVNSYGKWQGHLVQHVIFGFKDAIEIIVNLMIDDGLGSRATRKNMMNKGLRQLGIGICPHPLFGFVCVLIYAKVIEDYQEVLVNDPVAQILLARQLGD